MSNERQEPLLQNDESRNFDSEDVEEALTLMDLARNAKDFAREMSCSDLLGCFPIAAWLPSYFDKGLSERFLKDLQCGITVAAVCVPQGMAYGLLAEVPPVHGLYTAMLPAIAYMAFGSCLHLSVGPFALIAMLSGQGILAMNPDHDPVAAVELATLLSLMSGCILILFSFLQLGFLATFLSDPVLSGFCTASALIIPTSQLKYALQVQVKNGTFMAMLEGLVEQASEANTWSLSIFIFAVLAIFGIQKLNQNPPKFMAFLKRTPLPAELLVLVIATATCYIFDLGRCPGPCVKQLGQIPPGLPSIGLPPLAKYDMRELGSTALLIAVMTYIISMSVSKTFGRKFGYEVSNNQELLALGVSNLFGSVSGSFPAAASLSRTAIAGSAGAVSPMHNIVTVVSVAAVLQFFVSLVSPLPLAVLAAIVVMAFKSLLLNGVEECRWSLNVSLSDFLVWQISFWVTLTQSVSTAILMAVVADMAMLLWRTTRPTWKVLGRVGEKSYRGVENHEEAKTIPGVLMFRFNSPLHFANREAFASTIWSCVKDQEQGKLRSKMKKSNSTNFSIFRMLNFSKSAEKKEEVYSVVVDAGPMTHIDLSACRTFDKLRRELADRGTKLVLAHLNYECYTRMDAMGIFAALQVNDQQFDVVSFVDMHDAALYADGTLYKAKGAKLGRRASQMDILQQAGIAVGPAQPPSRPATRRASSLL